MSELGVVYVAAIDRGSVSFVDDTVCVGSLHTHSPWLALKWLN
jgi:hypothetical protein